MKKIIVLSLLALSILGFLSVQSPARAGECSGVTLADADNALSVGNGRWFPYDTKEQYLPYTGGSVATNSGGDTFIRQRPGC
jgi:hypothetical protein